MDWASGPSEVFLLRFDFGPDRRGELFNPGDFHRGQTGEQIPHVIVWNEAVPTATAQPELSRNLIGGQEGPRSSDCGLAVPCAPGYAFEARMQLIRS